VRLLLVRDVSTPVQDVEGILSFSVQEGVRPVEWYGHWPGAVRPRLEWQTVAVAD
jgi:lipopolysaccharide transport system ATP-binding protein